MFIYVYLNVATLFNSFLKKTINASVCIDDVYSIVLVIPVYFHVYICLSERGDTFQLLSQNTINASVCIDDVYSIVLVIPVYFHVHVWLFSSL